MLRAPDVTGFVMRHAHQLSPVRAGLMVTALRSFLPLSATPRSNRYRSCWLRAHRPQLVAFHASEVSSGCHGGTCSEVLRSKDVRWPAEPCDLAAARQARRARRRSRGAELGRYRLEHGADYHSRKGREIGPTAIGRRRRRGPCRLFTSRPPAFGHSQSVPSPPGSVSRLWELVDDLLARQAGSETCRRRVGAHRRPCASPLASHEPASAGRLAG